MHVNNSPNAPGFALSSDSPITLLQLAAGKAAAANEGVRSNQSTILVVDDESISRGILSRTLARNGFKVVEAANGHEALSIVKSADVDLIMLDIMMQGIDGFATLRLIRSMHDESTLPVIMMTASENRDPILQAFDSGANDYVNKPIDYPIALARIHAQLKLKHAQQELRSSEERYALAAQGTNDGMWDWNLLTGELYLSPRWRMMVAIPEPNWEPRGADWMQLIHHEDRGRVTSDLEAHLCGETKHFETELRMQDQAGGFRWMLCRGLAVTDERGLAYRIAGSLTDITEGKVADALTGLPNRILFHDRVARCVELFLRNPSRKFAVLYLDVNDFKLINDNFGHDVGDEFLLSIAQRLESALRKCDAVLARMGGDEFAILLENISGPEDAWNVAKRLHKELGKPFTVAQREILTQASIGIAPVTEKNASVESLMREADTAMYHAKRGSGSYISLFDSEMHEETSTRLELGAELQHAIRRDELSVHYQPIVAIDTNETFGFEALLRWRHPIHGNISPAQFIPIAESNGLIVEIGKWVLLQSCIQTALWTQKSQKPLIISVNVSIRQLTSPGFVEIVSEILEQTGLNPSQLKLEVTESLLMQNADAVIALLHQLRENGVTIGIDDFGTGYSSLAYLHQMPLNVLKIDRSFVTGLSESTKHQAIVQTIVALARSLQLAIVAEGVETADQLQKLKDLACDYVQGYLFSKPVRAEEAEGLINKKW